MAKLGGLTSKQLQVARAMHEEGLTEGEVVERFGVPERRLRRWLANEAMVQEFSRLNEESVRQTRSIISHFGPVAAARLVQLLDSEKADTARRAALDLVDRCMRQVASEGAGEAASEGQQGLSETEALRMLRTLAAGYGKE